MANENLQDGFEAGKYQVRSDEQVKKDLEACQDRIYEMIHNLPCALIQFMLDPIIRSTKTFELLFKAIGQAFDIINMAIDAVPGFPGSKIASPMGGGASPGAGLFGGEIPPPGKNNSGGGLTWSSAKSFNGSWGNIIVAHEKKSGGINGPGGRYSASQTDPEGKYGGWQVRVFGQDTTNYGDFSVNAALAFLTAVKGAQAQTDGIWGLQGGRNRDATYFARTIGPFNSKSALEEGHASGQVLWAIWFRELVPDESSSSSFST